MPVPATTSATPATSSESTPNDSPESTPQSTPQGTPQMSRPVASTLDTASATHEGEGVPALARARDDTARAAEGADAPEAVRDEETDDEAAAPRDGLGERGSKGARRAIRFSAELIVFSGENGERSTAMCTNPVLMPRPSLEDVCMIL